MLKNKIVYKLLSQTHKHLRNGELITTQLMEATTVDGSLKPIQRSGIKHMVGNVNPQINLGQKEIPWILGRSTPWHFEL